MQLLLHQYGSISSAGPNTADEIARALDAGELVCIFNAFEPRIEQVLARNPVPVVPIALQGLSGSFFSRTGGPLRPYARITVSAGDPLPSSATTEQLQNAVSALRGTND
jgi:hypothetical protein